MPGPLTAAELPSPVRGLDHPGPRTSASAPALKGSPSMTSNNTLLERVRKLLAKAESAGTTLPEAEALTAKAAELMAKYGIDRALLAAARPETGQPDPRVRLRLRHRTGRRALHLAAGADVAGHGRGGRARVDQEPAGVAAQLATGGRHRRSLPRPRRRAPGRMAGDRARGGGGALSGAGAR